MFLILDIGTSYLKCAVAHSGHELVGQYQRNFPLQQEGTAYEIDFELFFDTACDLLAECLDTAIIRDSGGPAALLITSQAQTFAAVDTEFKPLRKGIVWLDERAVREAKFLGSKLPDFGKTAGFRHPVPALYISKLLWLKWNQPDVFRQSKAFPLINEYLAYRLTGQFYSDSTSFGMSGLYDYRRNAVNADLLKILELPASCFPDMHTAGMRGELLTGNMQRIWKLRKRFPVFLCGNDQGASACGAGLRNPGDVNINFGTAMVVYAITGSLAGNLTENQISGKHPVGDNYFILNWEADFGIQMRRLRDSFFRNDSYDELFQTWFDYPDAARQQPRSEYAGMDFLSAESNHILCAGILKYYLNRLNLHLVQIRDTVDFHQIFLSGGAAQSQVWCEIIKKTLQKPVTVVKNSTEAGLLGAINIYLDCKARRY